MMEDKEIQILLDRVCQGDESAVQDLLAAHRSRLRRSIQFRMDPKIKARTDASDILQEALLEASQKLARFAQERPMAFFPWLWKIGLEHTIRHRRKHVEADKRSVNKEKMGQALTSNASQLLAKYYADQSSPSYQARRREFEERLTVALNKLSEMDRDILMMRVVDRLSSIEVAAILDINTNTIRSRQRRILERLRNELGDIHPD